MANHQGYRIGIVSRNSIILYAILFNLDTFDGGKPRFLNRGKKRRSVSTLSPSAVLMALTLSKGIPRALVLSGVEGSDRGVEWVD
jgi:hypothetical protein